MRLAELSIPQSRQIGDIEGQGTSDCNGAGQSDYAQWRKRGSNSCRPAGDRKPAHPLPLSQWNMRVLGAVIRALMWLVGDSWRDIPLGGSVEKKFIGGDARE